MSDDVERLVVLLEARVSEFEKRWLKAGNTASGVHNRMRSGARTASRGMERDMVRSANRIEQAFAHTSTRIGAFGRAFAAGFIGSVTIRELAKLSDSATRIDNALKVAGLSGEELERVYKRLNQSALANGAPIETLAGLYGKAAQSQKELGVTSEELLGFTNNVALALRVAGTDAKSASGALLQLGQALGSGRVQAEEFNSILEGAPTIAQAVAAGLKEAGGSVARLKSLIVDGKVSSEAFFRAFEAGAPMLEQKVAGSVFTLEQATVNLWTALVDAGREFNTATGAGERFAGSINSAANAINDFDISEFIEMVRDAKKEFDDYLSSLGNAQVFKDLNKVLGVTDANGKVINVDKKQAEDDVRALERQIEGLQQQIEQGARFKMDTADAEAQLRVFQGKLAEARAEAAAMPATVSGYSAGKSGIMPVSPLNDAPPLVYDRFEPPKKVKPVSLESFKPPPGRSTGGGGSAKAGRSDTDDLAREIAQIRERTDAINAMTAAQAGINPLIDDYGHAVEKARIKQDLLTAAQNAGKEITPELASRIDGLAQAYADASVASTRLAETQDEIRQRAEDMAAVQKDVARTVVDGFMQGKDAADIFADALKQIADTLINDVLDSLFRVNGAAGGGGLFGLLGSLFGGGGGGFPAPPGIGLYAKGGAFQSGISGFSNQVVDRPTMFAFAKGAGVMGEAGPEAIMPLRRDARGRLGVAAQGGGSAGGEDGAGSVKVDIGVSVDQDGQLQAFVRNVSEAAASNAIRKYDGEGYARTVGHVRKAQKNNVKLA